MKKNILCIFLSFFFIYNSINAQIEKRSILIDFDISADIFRSENYPSDLTQINCSLNSGYFFVKNLFTGLTVNYQLISYYYQILNDFTQNFCLSAGPMLRYYIKVKDFYFYPEISYSIGSYKINNSLFKEINKDFDFSQIQYKQSNFGVGMNYFLTKTLGLGINLKYQISDIEKNTNATDWRRERITLKQLLLFFNFSVKL